MTSSAAPYTIIVLAAPDAAKPPQWYRQQLAVRDTSGFVPIDAELTIASIAICPHAMKASDDLSDGLSDDLGDRSIGASAVVSSVITTVFRRARDGWNVCVVMDLGPTVTWDVITRFVVSHRMPLHTLTIAEVLPRWYAVTDGRPTKGMVHVVWT